MIQKGFTMIELLIVITVIALFSGFSIAAYTTFTEEKKLENATKKIVSVMELARSKTNSGNADLCTRGFFVTPAVENYTVSIVDNQAFRMTPSCYNEADGSSIVPTPITYTNEKGIIFPTTAPVIQTTFKKANTGADSACFVVRSTTLDKCRYVKIESSGMLTENLCSCSSCICQ